MTLYEFSLLYEEDQHEELWEHGVDIGEREAGGYKIILYQIHSFYVEIFYGIEDIVFKKLRCFSDTDELDVYLNEHKSDDLL